MKQACVQSAHVSARCDVCGERPEDALHLPENLGGFYCQRHCPICSPVAATADNAAHQPEAIIKPQPLRRLPGLSTIMQTTQDSDPAWLLAAVEAGKAAYRRICASRASPRSGRRATGQNRPAVGRRRSTTKELTYGKERST